MNNIVLKKTVITLMLVLIIVLPFTGCKDIDDTPDFRDDHFSIIDVDLEDLYYRYPLSNYINVDPFNYDADENGVNISFYNDQWYYNPVNISTRGLNFFDRFINIPDSTYFDYAKRHRDALIGLMNENALLEYRMEYHHLDIYFPDPWYSGMAQGLALSLFSMMAYYAQDTLSLSMANDLYKTLDPFSSISEEVVHIDSNNYAWIEEYPGQPSDHTFNGFMFAVFGIYDYYRLINHDESIRDVLSIYLTTIADNMWEFRNPGSISYYCLRHHHMNSVYHGVHIRQLKYLSTICDNPCFAEFADTLNSDY